MKIGILETGAPPGDLVQRFGRYDAMFKGLLSERHEMQTFKVHKGELPGPDARCGAYLVTGSPAGVYDDLPWIGPLKDFLRAVKGEAKLVGVCFGHQIMAEAFGGKVIKSPNGWGVGLHRYAITAHEPWMERVSDIDIPASHQDQVVEPPPNARVIATSAFTPIAALAYDDQPAISFQPHPEFEPAYAKALLVERRGTVDPTLAEAAIASLEAPNDCARVGRWIDNFLDDLVTAPRWSGPVGAES